MELQNRMRVWNETRGSGESMEWDRMSQGGEMELQAGMSHGEGSGMKSQSMKSTGFRGIG